ncbi:tRNA (guanine(10)-N2)-methyltransferase like protein [Dictyocoela roeselum]|nr:tRNA (guanine(10)-N2)-methyltransferase like protein [Dictyocoela roeselum]
MTISPKGNRKKYLKWGIKNRKFIGHTSLDLELSIFMINACRLKRGSVIIDPCCGSCSILHAAAIFGIYGIGSEIQRSELIGRNDAKNRSRTLAKGYDVYSNFYQFGVMNYILGVCVADLFNLPIKCLKDRNSFASNERIVHQGNVKMPQKIAEDHSANFEYDYKKPQKNVNTFRIDAILTDPPYGIRASVKGNIIDYFKKLLEIGRNCEYVGFWAISNHKKAIFEIFKNFKLICAVDQRLANYERTVFIYRMKRD